MEREFGPVVATGDEVIAVCLSFDPIGADCCSQVDRRTVGLVGASVPHYEPVPRRARIGVPGQDAVFESDVVYFPEFIPSDDRFAESFKRAVVVVSFGYRHNGKPVFGPQPEIGAVRKVDKEVGGVIDAPALIPDKKVEVVSDRPFDSVPSRRLSVPAHVRDGGEAYPGGVFIGPVVGV